MTRALMVVRFQELASTYLDPSEAVEIAEGFDLSVEGGDHYQSEAEYVRQLVGSAARRMTHGDNAQFLDVLLEVIQLRNTNAVADTGFESRVRHEELADRIAECRRYLSDESAPAEMVVPEGHEFTAKAETRDFFALAEDGLFVVDPYVSAVTLDCFLSVEPPIRLLTGTSERSVEGDFAEALRQFRTEGFEIEVRRHEVLHDRHAVFNKQCFLIGSSLKHAGRKQLNVIRFTDAKNAVTAVLEEKWNEAEQYEP